jgi:DNA-directed RNA polymerase subunit M/transcription elongation factor TFIIS
MDTTGKSWSAEYLPEDDKYIMSFGESTPAFEGLTRYEGDTSAYSGMYLGSVGYRNGRWFTDPWMEAGIDPPKELDLRPARTYRYPSDEELREIIGPKEWPGEKMVGEEPMRKFSRDRTRCPKCAGRPQIRVRILTNTSALQDSSVLLSCIECGWEWRELAMDQQAEDPDEELADRFLVMAPRGGEVEREFFRGSPGPCRRGCCSAQSGDPTAS